MDGAPAKCPVCAGGPVVAPRVFRGAPATYRCDACAVEFVHPVPSDAALAARYGYAAYGRVYDEATAGARQRRTATFAALFDRLEAAGRPGTLLDVGCSVGLLLEFARDRGWTVEGLERDPATAAGTAERLGIPVHVAVDLTGLPPGRAYDVIVLSHVLEHVRDPPALLAQVRDRLTPGGRLALRLPNSASALAGATGRLWSWYCPPIHLYYFDRSSLTSALERGGFVPLSVGTARGDAHAAPVELLDAVARAVLAVRRAPAVGGACYGEGAVLPPPVRRLRDRVDDLVSRLGWADDDSELSVVARRT